MTSRTSTDLYDKVVCSFFKSGLVVTEDPLLLLVSGGSDSVALLLLAHRYQASLSAGIAASDGSVLDKSSTQGVGSVLNKSSTTGDGYAPLLVLHVNHMLRGAQADADEDFVVALCEKLKVDCVVRRADIAAIAAETGEGTEQAGRRLRYAYAEEVLDAFCARLEREPQNGHILTAHTADDRAETLLQRLIVGGGSSSLASIPRRNGRIVRPLLDCTRQELQSWLREQNQIIAGCLWREDATNLDIKYSRAFVRHELLPLLASRNPRIIEGLNRTAEVLSDESAWMDTLALQLLPLSRESFSAPVPLLRRAIYLACNQAIAQFAPGARITFEHVELIASHGNTDGFACQIPGGIEVRTVRGLVQFAKAKAPKHDPRL